MLPQADVGTFLGRPRIPTDRTGWGPRRLASRLSPTIPLPDAFQSDKTSHASAATVGHSRLKTRIWRDFLGSPLPPADIPSSAGPPLLHRSRPATSLRPVPRIARLPRIVVDAHPLLRGGSQPTSRSEERRVGKECRS